MFNKMEFITSVATKYANMLNCFSEKSRRRWAATEALSYGHGGISLVCKATGMARSTIHRGINELKAQQTLPPSRIRRHGGGRKQLVDCQKNLLETLEGLIDSSSRGDPESTLRWMSKSIRNLTQELLKKGYKISETTTATLVHKCGYSLQANKKTLEGSSHKDRDEQFRYISSSVSDFQSRGQPTISVDTKKKENIGEYKNGGQELCQKGEPVKVNSHDFPDKRLGKVVPYGIYDIGKNKGWVSVGISGDTAEFSVNAIRTWWYKMGKCLYPDAKELLLTADCGGSNGYRVRLWKYELQRLADEIGICIHVRHFPPGTSKWNKIEHRLFSYISKNWRGKPLLTRETVVNLIANTRTKKGLEVRAILDENTYNKGKKISDKEFEALCIFGEDFHPEWNYKINPRPFSNT